jgi:hypothetical protein
MGRISFPERVCFKDGTERDIVMDVPILCDTGKVSDGYHTFDELYTHRHLLFCAMSKLVWSKTHFERLYCWKSNNHWINDEVIPVWEGWFLAGIELGSGMITYHLPLGYWDLFSGIKRDIPPPHDGHTSQDVIERLKGWLQQ